MKPSAVERAAQEAADAHKEAYGRMEVQDATAEEMTAEAQDPAQEATAEQPDVQAAESVAPESEPTQRAEPAESEVTADVWEQRYKTLQGMWKKDVPSLQSENSRLQGEISNLSSRLQDVESRAVEQADVADVPKFVTADDVDEFGEDLINVAKRAAQEAFAPELAKIAAENKRLKSELSGFSNQAQMSTRQLLLNEMDGKIPNWREINQSPEFVEWLQQVDPFSGQKKHDMLLGAFESNDAARTQRFFKAYLNENNAAVDTEVVATRQPQVDVEKLVSPGRPVNTGSPRAQVDSQKIWSNAAITKFYDDCKLGKYRGPEAIKRRHRIEADIIKAAGEGRIVS